MIIAGSHNAGALNPSIFPPAWPTLPLLPAAAILIAALPAVLTPAPPIAVAPVSRSTAPLDLTADDVATREPIGSHA
jgi:energy-coupling factor transport system permease protein